MEQSIGGDQPLSTEFVLPPGLIDLAEVENAAANFAPVLAEPVIFLIDTDFSGATFVGQLQAFDFEGDAISYSVTGGEDAALFTVDAITGELSFIDAVHFNDPLDADGDNQYVVDITTADAFGSSTHRVEVNLTGPICLDCPGQPEIVGPVPLAPFEPVRLFLNQSTSGEVTEIETVEAGSGEQFSLFGEDADRFDIDAATGLIALRSDAELSAQGSFDGDAIFEVVVLVENDLGGTATLEVEYLFFQGG